MSKLFASCIDGAPPIHYYTGPVSGKVFGRRDASKILGQSLCTYSNGKPRRFLLAVLTSDPEEVTCPACLKKLQEMENE